MEDTLLKGLAVDPLSHLVLTRLVLGPSRKVLAVAIAPDVPFYSCYPVWLVCHGLLAKSLRSGSWPDPPLWLLRTHRATHSVLPALILLAVGALLQQNSLRLIAASWLLHILVDLPTHRRDPWGPRPLWPFSDLAIEGVGWADILSARIASWLQQ